MMGFRSVCVGAVAMMTLIPLSFGQQPQAEISMFANNLMPQPASLSIAPGRFVLTSKFTYATTGFVDARLDAAIRDAISTLAQRTSLEMATTKGAAGAQLVVAVGGAGQAVQGVDEDESYNLTITPAHVQLEAATVVGAMRGLQTLLQLVQPDNGEYVLPMVTIHDTPRFAWRGLMIDCGRHFEPVDVIKRTLDGMAAVKLNVFHWHLTEDQGFRIESKIYPKLTTVGSDGQFYTQKDASDIVAYARARGIRVVPEFEMPGHSTAWLLAYPELASGRAPTEIRRKFGVSDYALDPTKEETYKFVEKFLAEMVTIFPDAYLHIGGDETVSPEWKSDAKILAFMSKNNLKDPDALQAYFNQRVLKILSKLNRHMIGWDEILNPALPKDVVVQSWRGEDSLVKGAQQGYQGLLSAGYYLDGMQPSGKHYLVDPLPASAALSPEQRKLILGGEVAMWGEQLNARTIDSRVWPRTAAIAERFWSPENVTDVDDMYRRLDVVSVQLEALGLHHLMQEDAGLRELAGTQEIDRLRDFASVLEPVSFGERYQQQHASADTVLDRFVDAVRPDPPSRHAIDVATRKFLLAPGQDVADQDALRHWFERMNAAAPAVLLQMQSSPRLAEVRPRAEQMPKLAQTGLDALNFLTYGNRAPAGWKQERLAWIEAAKTPAAVVRFTFLDSLTALVNAVKE